MQPSFILAGQTHLQAQILLLLLNCKGDPVKAHRKRSNINRLLITPQLITSSIIQLVILSDCYYNLMVQHSSVDYNLYYTSDQNQGFPEVQAAKFQSGDFQLEEQHSCLLRYVSILGLHRLCQHNI